MSACTALVKMYRLSKQIREFYMLLVSTQRMSRRYILKQFSHLPPLIFCPVCIEQEIHEAYS